MTKPTIILIHLTALLTLTTQISQAELVTVKEDGTGDYSSLSAAVDDIPPDITGGDQEPYEIKITGTWNDADITAVTIDNTTTDATNYIYIYTDSIARHNGKWDTSKYRLVIEDEVNRDGITISESYVRIEGLQIKRNIDSYANNNGIEISSMTDGEIRINHNIIRGTDDLVGNRYASGICYYNFSANNLVIKVWNNIIYDWNDADNDSEGIYSAYYGTFYIYNNTVINCDKGYEVSPNALGINNIAQNCDNGFRNSWGSWKAGTDYNISDIDGDAPNVNFGGGFATVTFVDEANDDFRLSSQDSAAKNQGTDSVSPINFTDDIQGQSRNWGAAGGAWDIGADEVITVDVIIGGDVAIGGNVTIGAY